MTSMTVISLTSLLMSIVTLILSIRFHQPLRKISIVYSILFFAVGIACNVWIFFERGFFEGWKVYEASNAVSFRLIEVNEQPTEAFPPHVSQPLKFEPSTLIDAPLVAQLPELPRGCEVTSLTMLLNHAGIEVDKLTLAEQVKKDQTSYVIKDGVVHFGNPHQGFVGDMYSLDNPGLGVYHEPIAELAEQYLPGQIIDLTGEDFDVIKYYLSQGKPVWVINNTWYSTLPESEFIEWMTNDGPIDITYRLHSVLVTGYDKDYIYVNDPLTNTKNRKIEKEPFIAGWKQMGKQAITYFQP